MSRGRRELGENQILKHNQGSTTGEKSKGIGQSPAAVAAASCRSCPPSPRPPAASHLSLFVCYLHPPGAASGAAALGAAPVEPPPPLRGRPPRSGSRQPAPPASSRFPRPKPRPGPFSSRSPSFFRCALRTRGSRHCPLLATPAAAGTGGEIKKQTSGKPWGGHPSRPAAGRGGGGCQPGLLGGSLPPGWPCAASPSRSCQGGKGTEGLSP